MKIYGTFLDVMEAVFTFISRNLYVIEVILSSKEVIKGRLITVDWAYEASVQYVIRSSAEATAVTWCGSYSIDFHST